MKKQKTRNQFKKITALIAIMLIAMNSFSIFASEIDETDLGKYRIYCAEDTEHYIKYKDKIQINYEYYYLNSNNERMPAYCVNLGANGPETNDEYYVNVQQALEDEIASSILLNGYPYITPYELGLPSDAQASYCTQFAIWAYLSHLDLNEITATKPEYENVVKAIKNIYHNGLENKSNTNGLIKIQVDESKIYDDNPNFYTVRVKLDYNMENVYKDTLTVHGLDKYVLLDTNTNMQIFPDAMYGIKDFTILVPREDITKDTSVTISLDYEARNASLMFGVAQITGMQDLVLIKNVREDRVVSKDFNISYIENQFIIKKVEKGNENVPIANVTFKLYDELGNELGEYVTDEYGIISLDYQKELGLTGGDKIIIEEISAPNQYFINPDHNKIEWILKYNEKNEVIIENEKSTGTIQIVKKSLDYNPYNNVKENTPLKDCEFEIYNQEMNLIEKVLTDKNGCANTGRLEIGNYYIKETKTNDYYILDNTIYEINILEHNSTNKITLYNKSMKKELPKTGF
ncbi:MAG: SpaA isopeptide-forming pilin-related protein [Clostridia bacterium]|nr:SpaA isopeptide-forming pilin-related protein [Clostridia bacterium]